MNVRPLLPLAPFALLLAVAGCGGAVQTTLPPADAALSAVATGAAVIAPTLGNEARGTVMFYEQKDGRVKVVADLEGLKPGMRHAMHVHEKGDCSAPDATSAGGHYNPENFPHSLPPHEPRHAGDLGNVTANSSGIAHYEITVDNLTIRGAKNPIEGRAVVVHASPDDGGQPVGNAGARLGCGVIETR
jgi:Cu-Zn family superoxide dismutase